jgi:hypothetical protein
VRPKRPPRGSLTVAPAGFPPERSRGAPGRSRLPGGDPADVAQHIRRLIEFLIADVGTDQTAHNLPVGGQTLGALRRGRLLGGQGLDELPYGQTALLRRFREAVAGLTRNPDRRCSRSVTINRLL